MRRVDSHQTVHVGGRSVGRQLAGVFAVNVPRQATRVAEDDGSDDAVNVIFRPRAGQDALRSTAAFRTQFCRETTNQISHFQCSPSIHFVIGIHYNQGGGVCKTLTFQNQSLKKYIDECEKLKEKKVMSVPSFT